MIKASAVAGAAAWTAPVIVDSLASPAAAGSVCTVYWLKIVDDSTTISFNCPGSSTFDVCDAYWANNTDPPTNPVSGGNCGTVANPRCGKLDDATSTQHLPASNVADPDHTNYRKITLGAGCKFVSTTGWQIGGRYNDSYLKVTTACSGAPTGAGCYSANGNTAWISKRLTPGNTSTTALDYVYLKYCCT